ncbi:DUF4430 domain-containing protein [Patescibacteria group bacterium]
MEHEPLTMEHKNKKTHWGGLLIIGVVAALAVLLGNNYLGTTTTETEIREGAVAGVETVREEVTLVISGGENVRTMNFNVAGGETALDILTRASLRENFVIDSTRFDFGVMVDAIDGVGGEENRFWLYYVNGNAATVGVDAYVAESGDIIEFRYE